MKQPPSMITIIQILLLLVAAAFLVQLIYPWISIYIGFSSLPDPPLPAITYGEFPFKLVYEMNGVEKVVEDNIVCRFEGIAAGSNGKWREWKAYLANEEALSKDSDVSLKIDDTNNIYFYLGDSRYYMGEAGYENLNFRVYHLKTLGGLTTRKTLSTAELLDQYGIKLISWVFSPPIQNEFK